MHDLDKVSYQVEAEAARAPEVLISTWYPLISIRSMDASRNNDVANHLLGSFQILKEDTKNFAETKVHSEREYETELPKDLAPVQVCQNLDQVNPTFEQAERLKQQTFQDCRDGRFSDAIRHRKEALEKYYEYYNNNPPTSPDSL